MILTFPAIQVRTATDTDNAALTDLIHESWLEVYAPRLPLQISGGRNRGHSARLVETRSSASWVAVQGPRLLGYCSVHGNCVDQLWVRRTQRRRGVGTRLLGRALEYLVERDFQNAQAGCEDFNAPMQHFLLHNGWRVIGHETQTLAPNFVVTALVYGIELAVAAKRANGCPASAPKTVHSDRET